MSRNHPWCRPLAGLVFGLILVGCGGGRFGPASSQRPLILPGGEHEITLGVGGIKTLGGPVQPTLGGLGYRYGLSDRWNLVLLPLPVLARGFEIHAGLELAAVAGLYGLGFGMATSTPRDPRYQAQSDERYDFVPGGGIIGRLRLDESSGLLGAAHLATRFSTDHTRGVGGGLGAAYLLDLSPRFTLGLGASVSRDAFERKGVAFALGGPSVGLGTPPLLAFHVTDGLDLTGTAWWTGDFEGSRARLAATLGIDWYWD